MENFNDDPWYYEMIDLGFNYRMTDIHAALGISQINRLRNFWMQTCRIADIYDKEFANNSMSVQMRDPNNVSALHLYIIQVSRDKHKAIFRALRGDGIGVNLHYIPVHTQPYYTKMGFAWGDFPVSENYYRQALSLPIFPDLKSSEQEYIIDRLSST